MQAMACADATTRVMNESHWQAGITGGISVARLVIKLG
jgi:hypothetical protein